MNKIINLSLFLVVSMASSLAYGSMSGRLQRAARIAKNATLGLTGAAAGGSVSYSMAYILYPKRWCNRHGGDKASVYYIDTSREDACEAQDVAIVSGFVGAVAGSCLGGPTGVAAFATATVLGAAGCVKAMQKK